MAGWRVIALGLLVLAPVRAGAEETPQAKDTEDVSLRTWAVLSSNVPDAALSDLANAELAGTDGIQLVEREKLESITDERIRGLLLSADIAERPKLGKMLKADALVLLSTESREGAPILRIVIVECAYGTRLSTVVLPYREDGLETAAKAVKQAVLDARRQTAGGIKLLVAVPHFLSKDFTHEFDHLQAACAAVIAGALSRTPGVAVVELDEAEAIRKELETGGAELEQRVLPLIVEGEFETTGNKDAKKVRFRIRIRDGEKVVREIEPSPVAPASIGKCLDEAVRTEILPLAGAGVESPLSPKQQFAALTQRADAFAAVGDWELSTGLREAAVLLDPDAGDQRLLLVREYLRLVKDACSELRGISPKPKFNPAIQQIITDRYGIWLTGLRHLEYVIRNKQIRLDELQWLGPDYLRAVAWAFAQGYRLPFDFQKEVMRFLRVAIPAEETQSLTPENARARSMAMDYWRCSPLRYATLIAYRIQPDDDYSDEFATLLEVIEEWIPENVLVGSHEFFYLGEGGSVSPNEDFRVAHEAFLRRLARSKRLSIAFVGRSRLFVRSLRPQKSPSYTREQLAQLEELLSLCERLEEQFRNRHTATNQLKTTLLRHRRKARQQLGIDTKKPRVAYSSSKQKRGFGRLRFEPLKLSVKRLPGNSSPRSGWKWRGYSGWGCITRWTPCGPGLDVASNFGVILFMHERDVLEERFVDHEPIFDDVRWDGRHVWVATRNQGIWVLDTSGKVVERVTEEAGLPPADRGIRLHVLGEGRLAAAGAFGKHHRSWCAILNRDEKSTAVNVVVRATLVPSKYDRENWYKTKSDTRCVFEPSWMHVLHPPGEGEAPRLIVGRKPSPLIVNLKTFELSSYPANTLKGPRFPGGWLRSEGYFSRGGTLLVAGHRTVGVYELEKDGIGFRQVRRHRTSDRTTVFFRHDGWIYHSGIRWSRFDPETLEEEVLTPNDLPLGYGGLGAAASSHYGIVAFGGYGPASGKFFRVHVLEKGESDADGAKE